MNERVNAIGQIAIAAVSSPAPALFLHCAIFLARNRLISDETFRLVSFQGQESVSEPFEYQLELHGNTSVRHGTPLSFDDVIGRPVTVGIQYPSTYTQVEMADRFQRAIRGGATGEELSLFNGIVTAFSMDIPGVYRLTMKPALWKLSLTNAYAVHRKMHIRDTIAKLLEPHRIAYSLDAVSGTDNPATARIQDWLQAGETDLEFLRRLMGKAHLYYYFVHTGNSHKMVFANRPETPYPYVFSSRKPLRYTFTAQDELGLAQSDVISQYSYQRSLVSSAVRSVFTRQEAAWEEDAVAKLQSFEAVSESDLGELPFNQYKIYQYGCSSDEVRHFTESTHSAMESSGCQFSGSSYCAHFRVGHQFSVTGEQMAASRPMPVQPSLEGQRFVLTQVKHQASADGGYQNEFQSTEASGFIASFSMQETQQGVILAEVVEKSGDAPVQDWRYYTADYFDPETNTLVDNAAGSELKAMGVYVRFSTADKNSEPVWVKLAPHMQTVPEIGTTVLVTRAQDESELPEIQSIIQANGSMVIMPSTWTANTHVGSSYSTNYGDGQSIRFGKNSTANLKTAVGIVSNAYNSGTYRDTSYSQGASYSFSTSESNAGTPSNSGELFGPYAGASDLLSASESFGSTYSRQYAQVTSGFSKVGTSYNKSTVDQSVSDSTIGTQDNTSVVGMSTSSSILGMSVSTEIIGSTTSMQVIGNSNSVQTTGLTNGMSTVGMSNQLSINGVSNNIALMGSSNSIAVTGDSTSVGATGARINTEVVGVSTNTSVTGASTNVSLLGASSGVSLTGSSTDVGIVGMSTRVNVTGASTECSIVSMDNRISIRDLCNSIDLFNSGISLQSNPARIKTEIYGPDINMPAIKIIL